MNDKENPFDIFIIIEDGIGSKSVSNSIWGKRGKDVV